MPDRFPIRRMDTSRECHPGCFNPGNGPYGRLTSHFHLPHKLSLQVDAFPGLRVVEAFYISIGVRFLRAATDSNDSLARCRDHPVEILCTLRQETDPVQASF